MAAIYFQDSSGEDRFDGWKEFSVSHTGALHKLHMCYAAQFSTPCRIRIANNDMWVSVAMGTTEDNDTPTWFQDEGTFDLGESGGITTVGFRPVSGKKFPNIQAFQFVPELRRNKTRDFELERDDCSIRWRKVPTAATFTFEIGIPSNALAQEEDVEYLATFLRSKAITFRFGEAHDAINIDGDPIGKNQCGGDTFANVTFVEGDDFISSATLGLSSFTGEGAFTALTLEKRDSRTIKRPLVGANLVEPAWTYDCRRLGLNLWITSLVAPMHKPISRYGFTLSSDDSLEFNPEEFHRFWDWLVQIKLTMSTPEGNENALDLDCVRFAMEAQRKFLLESFSCRPSNPLSSEGYLYGSLRHVSITFDVFSIFIYRLPDGETFQSTLFVDGKQYNTKKSRMEEIRLMRNDVLAFAISVALQDTDLLFQMGLIRPVNCYSKEEQELDEIEIIPLKNGTALFSGDYCNTVMARRAVTLLALAGLRKVSYETVMNDSHGWDIYDVAAGAASGMYGSYAQMRMELGAICCAMIQIGVPVCLIYRGLQDDIPEITWDVYLARLLFGTYAIFHEVKTWAVDNEDRVTGWLCFLPEYNTRRLIMGLLINKLSKIVVFVAMIVLMIRSSSVFDVALNALALYFIVEVDDELVDDRTLEEQKLHQRRELFILKCKTAPEYQLPSFEDEELPNLKNLPARYFQIASNKVSSLTIICLILGCLWMIVEPWALGWTITT
jgi:hypothetical protein